MKGYKNKSYMLVNVFSEEIKTFTPDVFTDYRGELWTTWKKEWKLVTCLYGELYFVVVDNRKDSMTYLEWDCAILNDKNRKLVLIPPGFGNSFCVLSDYSIFMYKWSYKGKYPDVKDQFTLKWNDPKIGINWPIDNPILQSRDK